MAFASCSNYPSTASSPPTGTWPRSSPTLILHLGDYQYEYGAGTDTRSAARVTSGPETVTLANYRQRHAQYKTDPDLQARARGRRRGWWCGTTTRSTTTTPTRSRRTSSTRRTFLRAAGRGVPGLLREHAAAPLLGAAAGPTCSSTAGSAGAGWPPSTCSTPGSTAPTRPAATATRTARTAADPARSLPGTAQEDWLLDGFQQSDTRVGPARASRSSSARRDNDAGAANTVSMDAWDGYPASRDRIVQAWRGRPGAQPRGADR